MDINKKAFEAMDSNEIVLELFYTDNRDNNPHSFYPAVEGQEITITASGSKFHIQCPHAILADDKTGEERVLYINTWNP